MGFPYLNAAVSTLAPVETWWAAHAALPSLAAFFLGLAVGTIFLPALWVQVRPHIFPLKLRPDVDGATAFKEVLAKSRRAKELVRPGKLTVPVMYETHLTEFGVIEGRLKAQIADEFHDLLRQGDITAWGSPDGKKPHQKIKPEEWSEIAIDFDEQDMNYNPPHVHAVKRRNDGRGTVFGYVWVRLNRKQVRKAFPLSWWPRRIPNKPKEKRHLPKTGD